MTLKHSDIFKSRSPRKLIAAICVGAMLSTKGALACSTVVFDAGRDVLVGRNTDSAIDLPGMFLINKRGIRKNALPWSVFGLARSGGPTAQWASRYGSLTVTSIGREFPDGGMNEAGLVVEEMSLDESLYPEPKGNPTISQVQWIQYQLDNFASVAEVISHLNRLGMTGWGWHFIVADSTGDCAAIEFVGGRAIVSPHDASGGDCVLTNNTVSQSRAHVAELGPAAPPTDQSSLSRFARASRELAVYKPRDARGSVDFAFHVLDSIAQGRITLRSIVHDIGKRRIYFRTRDHRDIKYIDLHEVDFSAATPVTMIDIETARGGDVSMQMIPYTAAADRKIVAGFYHVVRLTRDALRQWNKDLQADRLTQTEFIDRLVAYPETLRAE